MSRTIIVTGASRGIGLAICTQLLDELERPNIVAVARDFAALSRLQALAPSRIAIIACDLGNAEAGTKIVAKAIERFGRIDGVIINHAVISPVAYVGKSDAVDWRETFNINFFGSLELIQTALPHIRRTNGRIIFLSTATAKYTSATRAWGAYGASKAALLHLAATLTLEEPDITTLSVIPGYVDTDMSTEVRNLHAGSMYKPDMDHLLNSWDNGGFVQPEQPGAVVASLALRAGSDLQGVYLNWNDSRFAPVVHEHYAGQSGMNMMKVPFETMSRISVAQ